MGVKAGALRPGGGAGARRGLRMFSGDGGGGDGGGGRASGRAGTQEGVLSLQLVENM